MRFNLPKNNIHCLNTSGNLSGLFRYGRILAHFLRSGNLRRKFPDRKKPGFPLQVLGSANALPVGFPLQSLAQRQRKTASRFCRHLCAPRVFPVVEQAPGIITASFPFINFSIAIGMTIISYDGFSTLSR
ncbi:MAG: hypothetical protein LBK13_11910, partial [Spirochaetales bacterium]|nr:hypothetical protein [Spirochaetales bacterium]